MFDTPLATLNPEELFNETNPGAHAESAPPAKQPSNDNDMNRSIATATPTVRRRLLLGRTTITSFAQRLISSCSHFFTYLSFQGSRAHEFVSLCSVKSSRGSR